MVYCWGRPRGEAGGELEVSYWKEGQSREVWGWGAGGVGVGVVGREMMEGWENKRGEDPLRLLHNNIIVRRDQTASDWVWEWFVILSTTMFFSENLISWQFHHLRAHSVWITRLAALRHTKPNLAQWVIASRSLQGSTSQTDHTYTLSIKPYLRLIKGNF